MKMSMPIKASRTTAMPTMVHVFEKKLKMVSITSTLSDVCLGDGNASRPAGAQCPAPSGKATMFYRRAARDASARSRK